jgi:hypothetical protein
VLIGLMGRLSRWLETRGLDAAGLTADVAEEFLRARTDADLRCPEFLGLEIH